MIEIISDFVNARKAQWLESKQKNATDEEKERWQLQAAEKFSLANWLLDAAKRAEQLAITTHTCKFTHPSAKSTSIIANSSQKNDGYLRSGNVMDNSLDIFGNAAAMDVYKFLSLSIKDSSGPTLLEAFEHSDKRLQDCINGLNLDFATLREDFLKIKHGSGAIKTDSLLKQVYYPISKDDTKYHLLSLLTASGLMTVLKRRIDNMRFGDAAKQARAAKKAGVMDEHGYSDVFDLTVIGYGGTKPQNISVLNTQNGGKAYLLPSIPPLFEKRPVRIPTQDFFTQTLYLKAEKQRFITLHRWVQQKQNNQEVRQTIRNIIDGIIDQILYKAYQLRQNNEPGWSNQDDYQTLPLNQRIWLDVQHTVERQASSIWREEIAKDIARLIVAMYEEINKAKILSDKELTYIAELVEQGLEEDKEFF